MTISHPQLVPEDSSDGWRTATLLVPDNAPVPPPRKKRKRNQDLARTAYSMDDLNRAEPLSMSTMSLVDMSHSESGLDLKSSSSSTLVVSSIIETPRGCSEIKSEGTKIKEENKENAFIQCKVIDEEKEDSEDVVADDLPEEIIPIENETMYSSRTILHSNLGYIDKLSAISEVSTVSTESGFDDRLDICKSSELSGSVTSSDSAPRDSGLNILAHIPNINSASDNQSNDNKETRERTAISKSEWLQNILKQDPEPFFLARETKKDILPESDTQNKTEVFTTPPESLPIEHLNLANQKTIELETGKVDGDIIPTTSPVTSNIPFKLDTNPTVNCVEDINHSVLYELIQANKTFPNQVVDLNPIAHKEESIFLKDTKTNIIYKSLSSDKLSEVNDDDFLIPDGDVILQLDASSSSPNEELTKSAPAKEGNSTSDSTNLVNNSESKSHLTDYFFQAPRLVHSDDGLNSIPTGNDRSNPVSSLDLHETAQSEGCKSSLKDDRLPNERASVLVNNEVVVNGIKPNLDGLPVADKRTTVSDIKEADKPTPKEHLTKKDSVSSSRRSSITDSLHEFEISIYDMLKESKKNRDSSDEEESLKTIKTESRK